MKNLFFLAFVLFFSTSYLQGCGGGGGSGSSSIADGPSLQVFEVGEAGNLIDLGDLVEPEGDHWYYTQAVGINDQGTVIGQSNNGFPVKGAFKWDAVSGEMEFLGIHSQNYTDYYTQFIMAPIQNPPLFNFSEAVEAIGSGTIIGNSLTGYPGEKRAFLWKDGTFTDLPPIPGKIIQFIEPGPDNVGAIQFEITQYSEAVDINEAGEMVLTLDDNTEAGRHAYYWDGVSFIDANLGRDDISLIPIVVPAYEPLGAVVGSTSEAVAINENGQALINSGGTVIFVDRNWGIIESLNHLPGTALSVAVDINDSIYTNNDGIPDGHVIGNSGNFSENGLNNAIYGRSGLVIQTAASIDFGDGGDVPGDGGTDQPNGEEPTEELLGLGVWESAVKGFFWDGGAMYPISDLGGGASAVTDINNKDQVVGGALTADGKTRAILWTLGPDKKGVIKDLGTLGGDHSFALAINEAGQIVGWSSTGEFYTEDGLTEPIIHGFLWDNGTMYDLGTHNYFYDYPFIPSYPFSAAVDVNESGELVGNSLTINSHSRGLYLAPSLSAP